MEKLFNRINEMFVKEDVNEKGYAFEGDVEKLILLNEAIPISMYREWHKKLKELKGHGGTTYKERFDSWFTPSKDAEGRRLGSKFRVYIPYGGSAPSTKPLSAPKDIIGALEKEGWTIENYNTGMATKKGGDKKDIKAEQWNKEKQYKALDFVKHNGKTWKAIKNPAIGISPEDNKEKQWLDFEKISGGGAGKKVEKSIGGILADLTASAKKAGDVEKEKFYSGLERKNQTLQGRIQERGKGGKQLSDQYVVISRHPYDVMGASADKGWGSCQNIGVGQDDYSTTVGRSKVKEWKKTIEYKSGDMVISGDKIYKAIEKNKDEKPESSKDAWKIDDQFLVTNKKDKETGKIFKVATRRFEKGEGGICRVGKTGAYYHGIGADVRYGAMIAYLIDADDIDINNPKARMLIKPYVKMDGNNKGSVYLFASPSQYGMSGRITDDKIFRKTVDDWLEDHQTGEGVYRIKQRSISSSEPLSTQKWEEHYPEEPSEMTVKSYKVNEKNIKEFKDGLTWNDVVDQHRWFAKNTFQNVVLGEEYGKLIMYSGSVTNGSWEDDAEALNGEINNVFINKGTFKNVELSKCEVTVGTFDKCSLEDTKWKIRGKMNNCKVNKMTITGSINAINSEFDNINFGDIPEDSKLMFKNCSFENSKKLKGTFQDCTFKNDVTLSDDVNIIDATYDGINQTGGKFSGVLKSGTLKDVEIKKIIAKGGTLIKCDVKHGIIENAILKNCKFHSGIFGYTPGLGKKTVSKLQPKSSRNRSKFFGGEFLGGTFAGGDFIKGVWHNEATWKGGYWHSGTNKPKNAKTKEDVKVNKGIDVGARLLAKTAKPENEEE